MKNAETSAETEAAEGYQIVTCEGCASKWALRGGLKNELAADLIECPLCAKPS